MTDDWFSAESATFGDRIEGARQASGMTQGELARRLGVELETLKSWEEDLSEPQADKLQLMAELLNVSLTWLLNGVGDGVPAPDDDREISPDIAATLAEMREVRTEMVRLADRLAVLEKRLRMSLKEGLPE